MTKVFAKERIVGDWKVKDLFSQILFKIRRDSRSPISIEGEVGRAYQLYGGGYFLPVFLRNGREGA